MKCGDEKLALKDHVTVKYNKLKHKMKMDDSNSELA